jgi:hypothetical protein
MRVCDINFLLQLDVILVMIRLGFCVCFLFLMCLFPFADCSGMDGIALLQLKKSGGMKVEKQEKMGNISSKGAEAEEDEEEGKARLICLVPSSDDGHFNILPLSVQSYIVVE